MKPDDYLWAVGIAVVASLVLSCIEIPAKAKTAIKACLGPQSFFYWVVLSFGNVVTTLLASTAVTTLPATFAPWFFLLCPFFGVFAFEAILKNTNITMFDKGVLTIQNWIEKALNAAAAAAIDRHEQIKATDENALVARLMGRTEADINTLVLNRMGPGKVEALDAAAQASSANSKMYKVLQLVTTMSNNERTAVLNGR